MNAALIQATLFRGASAYRSHSGSSPVRMSTRSSSFLSKHINITASSISCYDSISFSRTTRMNRSGIHRFMIPYSHSARREEKWK